MAKYKKRADGRYATQMQIGYQDNGKPKYKSLYGRTITELDKKVVEFKSNFNKGIIIDDKNITVGEWAGIWLETYKNNVAYNTKKMYDDCIKNHIKGTDIENIPLSKLKTINLQSLINGKLDIGLTRTVKILQLTLKQMLKQAIENELIYKNVADNIKLPTFQREEKRVLTDEEKQAIANADFTTKERAFVYLALYAGLRRGEILALSRQDIDLKNKLIKVNKNLVFKENTSEIKDCPKTKSGIREIPIIEPLFFVIKEHLKSINTIYLFTTQTHDLTTKSSYRRMWEAIAKKIDSNCTCHILRHTFATNLYYAGIDIKTAQKLLGHANVSVTLDIYTHLETNNKDVADKLTNYNNINQSEISQM